MTKPLSVVSLVILTISTAGAEAFVKTKVVDPKGRELPVSLEFDGGRRMMCVKLHKSNFAEVPYANVDKLAYEMASRHRVKEGAVVMIASLGAGAILMATKSKNHWLYVDYKDEKGSAQTLTMKLDKSEYEKALKTAAAETGKEVTTLVPAKKK